MPNISSFGAQTDNAVVSGTVADRQMIIPEVPPQGLMSIGPRVTFNFVKPRFWSDQTTYHFYDAVRDVDGAAYVAIKPVVPAGTPLTDEDYWFLWADPDTRFDELNGLIQTLQGKVQSFETSLNLIAKKATLITPEQFGAVGDGVTDDTEAVKKALATNGNVYLAGTYAINTIELNEFNGTVTGGSLKGLAQNTGVVIADTTGCSIANVTMRDINLIFKNGSNIAVKNNFYFNYGIAVLLIGGTFENVDICDNIIVNQYACDDSTANANQNYGAISAQQATIKNILISGNIIDKTNTFGVIIFICNCENVHIDGNNIYEVGANRTGNENSGCGGIYCRNTVYVTFSDIAVTNNVIKYVNETGIEGLYKVVSGNVVSDCGFYNREHYIGDNQCIFGDSKSITNNVCINPGERGNINVVTTELSNTIICDNNTFINTYKKFTPQTGVLKNDQLRYGDKVYICTRTGNLGDAFTPNDTTEFDCGSAAFIYLKKAHKYNYTFITPNTVYLIDNNPYVTIDNYQAKLHAEVNYAYVHGSFVALKMRVGHLKTIEIAPMFNDKNPFNNSTIQDGRIVFSSNSGQYNFKVNTKEKYTYVASSILEGSKDAVLTLGEVPFNNKAELITTNKNIIYASTSESIIVDYMLLDIYKTLEYELI